MQLKFSKKRNYDTTPGTITFSTGTKMIGVAKSDSTIMEMGGGYASDLTWGNRTNTATLSAGGVAIASDFGANRFAWYDLDNITLEDSRDGGQSWTPRELNKNQKTWLTTNPGAVSLPIGNWKSGETFQSNWQSRVIFNNPAGSNTVYCKICMFLINISTQGMQPVTVKCVGTNGNNEELEFFEEEISGWSGWNTIFYNCTFGGSASQSQKSQFFKLTFTFSCEEYAGTTAPNIMNIFAYSDTIWSAKNPLALLGHTCSPMANMNVRFPNNIYVHDNDTEEYRLTTTSDVNALITDSWTWGEYD